MDSIRLIFVPDKALSRRNTGGILRGSNTVWGKKKAEDGR
jgi:hypothetical protein